MKCDLSEQAKKYISRWTKDEFYVYIRPVSSRFSEPDKKHRTLWAVSVEYRFVEYKQWRSEGEDLDAVICELGEKIPRRKQFQPGYKGGNPKNNPGWLAPESVRRIVAKKEKAPPRSKRTKKKKGKKRAAID